MKKVIFSLGISVSLLFSDTIIVDNDPDCTYTMHGRECKACDGSEDYKEKIQDALDSAADGDTIKICPSKYEENNLNINKNITIKSTSDNVDDVNVTDSSDNPIFKTSGYRDGVVFYGFTIDQRKSNQKAFYISDGTDYNFTNMNIDSNGSGFKIDKIHNSHFDNININSDQEGVDVNESYDGFDLNNSFIKSDKNGSIYFNTLDGKLTIDSTEITSQNQIGVTINEANKVTISNCNIHDTKFNGIEIKNSTKTVNLYNNFIDNSGEHCVYIHNVSNSGEIKNNIFKGATDKGLLLLQNEKGLGYNIINNCFENGSDKNIDSKDTDGIFDDGEYGNYWDDWNGSDTYSVPSIPKVDNYPLSECKVKAYKTLIYYHMDECSWDNNSSTYEIKNFGILGTDYDANAINDANSTEDGKIYRGGDINSSSEDDKAILAKDNYSLPKKYTLTTWIKFPLNTDGHKEFTEGSGWNSKKVEYFNIADRVGKDKDFIYFTRDVDNDSWSLSVKDDDDTKTIDFNPQDLSDWHMLTFVVTDDGTDFYLDKDKNDTFDTHPNTGELGLLFNSDYDADNDNEANEQSIGAEVDEFQIFNKDLNSSQIEDIYNYNGSDIDAPQCSINAFFDAWNTFRDIDDKNISTEIVSRQFNLIIASLDENGSDYKEFNGTVCSRVIVQNDKNVTDWVKNFFNDKNTSDQTDENNPDFNVTQAIKKAKIEIIWLKDENISCGDVESSSDHNETNSTDNFAIRPNEFNISTSSNSIYAGEDFNITFKAVSIDDANATDYNESNGSSFDINVSEIKNGCVKGNYSGDVTFSDGGNTTVANYDEVGKIDINISDENISCKDRFAGVDCKDKNITGHWNSDKNTSIGSKSINISVNPYELNITKLDFNISTHNSWLYMADNINDMNITLKSTLKAFNKQGDTLQDFNSTCYAQDVNVTFYYNINSSEYDVNLTLDGNLTSNDVNISDINKTLQISKELFIAGEANSSYSFGIDRNYNIYKNPTNITLKEANITTKNIARNENNISMDENATFYYGRTYPQDLSTSKSSDTTKVEILIYSDTILKDDNNNSLKEELLNWYLNSMHTNNSFGDINESLPSTSIQKSQTTEINSSISSITNGVYTVEVNTTEQTKGTYFIHLGENKWLWYVPQNFGNDYNYTNNSDCSQHPCIKYNYEQNKYNNGVTSGETSGVHFDLNISKNNRGVRLLR